MSFVDPVLLLIAASADILLPNPRHLVKYLPDLLIALHKQSNSLFIDIALVHVSGSVTNGTDI